MIQPSTKLATLAIASVTLTGCALNGIPNPIPNVTPEQVDGVEKTFAGIPAVLAIEGSTVRLDEDWLLTNAHNEPILKLTGADYIKHPTCDVALVKDSGEPIDYGFGVIYPYEEITHVGYPIFMPLSSSNGMYFQDVITTNFPNCKMSMSTGTLMSGMSGGGVFNKRGELVGVNQGILLFKDMVFDGNTYSSPSVFVSLLAVIDWIEETTNRTYTINYDR